MFDEAARFCVDVLVEVHTADELKRAIAAGATLIGMNNRDLRTFETDLDLTVKLLPLVPPGTLILSESGLRTGADTQRLYTAGARGFLVGESLMRAGDKAALLSELKSVSVSV